MRAAERNWTEFGSMAAVGTMAAVPIAAGTGNFLMPCERMQAA
jgi:hypothetical protein